MADVLDRVCDEASLIGVKTCLERRILVTSRCITIACNGPLSPSKITEFVIVLSGVARMRSQQSPLTRDANHHGRHCGPSV